MIYTDIDIREAINSGEFKIDPYSPELIGPCSIDVRLSESFARLVANDYNRVIDPRNSNTFSHEWIRAEEYIIFPGEFVLGATLETVHIGPSIVGELTGRSSFGRLALLIHATAGLVDSGVHGTLTLELANLGGNAIKLRAGDVIGQIVIYQTKSKCAVTYGERKYSKYQNQVHATGSKYYQDFQKD